MKALTASDALRLILIASLGLPAFACESGTATGDGDIGDGDGNEFQVTGCTNPEPFVRGVDSGFVRCEEGYVHREEQKECPSSLPREGDLLSAGGAGGGNSLDECASDADCEGDLSFCSLVSGGEDGSYLACRSSCLTDSDCQDGFVCLCGEEFGTCAPGSANSAEGGCNTDDDCNSGEMCVAAYYDDGCGGGRYEFSCTPFQLTCDDPEASCAFIDCAVVEGEIQCGPEGICGRPFLVEAEDRKAEATCRDDWCAAEGSASYLGSEEERAIAAQYFERIALMEHASIAAFARFSLQLLSLGAPAAFIEQTNQALVDETKHARLAFRLASRFAEKKLGPGPLDVDAALADDSPEAILTTTILEGCVGETMAALEARAALALAKDEEVRHALEQIAEDEARHAELAWGVVQWMLRERPELRPLAERTFAQATSRRDSVGPTRSGAPSLGVLSGAQLASVHAEALDKVVIPCAVGLLSSGGERESVQPRA